MRDVMSMLLMPLGGKTDTVLSIYAWVYIILCILLGTFPEQKFIRTYKVVYLCICYRTPLHYAASTAQFQCVLSLVANGALVNVLDNGKRTPLHYASSSDGDAK